MLCRIYAVEFTPSQHKCDVMLKKKTSLFEVFASDNDVKMIDIKISSKSPQKIMIVHASL